MNVCFWPRAATSRLPRQLTFNLGVLLRARSYRSTTWRRLTAAKQDRVLTLTATTGRSRATAVDHVAEMTSVVCGTASVNAASTAWRCLDMVDSYSSRCDECVPAPIEALRRWKGVLGQGAVDSMLVLDRSGL